MIASALVSQQGEFSSLREGKGVVDDHLCCLDHSLVSLPIHNGAMQEHRNTVGQDTVDGRGVEDHQQPLTYIIFF